MKPSIYYYLLFFTCFFLSCSKDNDEPVSQTPRWNMGYFKGTVNGKVVDIENKTSNDRFIHPGVYVQQRTGIKEYLWGMTFGEQKVSKIDRLSMGIIPFGEGLFEITQGFQDEKNANIGGTLIDKINGNIDYDPLKAPFKVWIDSIRFYPLSSMPYIYGRMEGILYNVNDLNDSIVIENVKFGIH